MRGAFLATHHMVARQEYDVFDLHLVDVCSSIASVGRGVLVAAVRRAILSRFSSH